MVIQPGNDLTANTSHARQKGLNQSVSSSTDKTQAAPSSVVGDTEKNVQLSTQAQSIERLEAKITASDGVDTAKVEQIKQQIAEGSYTIDSQRLADNLLKQDQSLSGF